MTEPTDPNARWPQSSPGQPYGGQAYPGRPYPTQPYPTEPYSGDPYRPWPPMQPVAGQPPLRRKKTRTTVIAALAAAIVVAGGIVAAVLATGHSNTAGSANAGSSTSRSTNSGMLVAPDTVGPYHVASNSAISRMEGAMRGMAPGMSGSAADFVNHATITVYSEQGDSPSLIFVGTTRDEAAALGGAGVSDQELVDDLFSGALSHSQPYDSGSRGGALDCGGAAFGAAQETMCAWSDVHTIGVLVSVNPAKAPQQLADTANQFRDKLS